MIGLDHLYHLSNKKNLIAFISLARSNRYKDENDRKQKKNGANGNGKGNGKRVTALREVTRL